MIVTNTPNGTTIRVPPRPGGSAGGDEPATHPFQVVDASDESSARIRVVFGQVDSVTPTLLEEPINADPAPNILVGTGLIVLRVNLDEDGLVDTAEIIHVEELPEDTATEGHITLAEVTVEDDAVTAIDQSVTHSLQHQKCGETLHNFWAV